MAIRKIENIAGAGFDNYDSDRQDIAERNLQIAIEAIIDIGQKIISAQNWDIPDTYRGLIKKYYGYVIGL